MPSGLVHLGRSHHTPKQMQDVPAQRRQGGGGEAVTLGMGVRVVGQVARTATAAVAKAAATSSSRCTSGTLESSASAARCDLAAQARGAISRGSPLRVSTRPTRNICVRSFVRSWSERRRARGTVLPPLCRPMRCCPRAGHKDQSNFWSFLTDFRGISCDIIDLESCTKPVHNRGGWWVVGGGWWVVGGSWWLVASCQRTG